MKRSSNFWDVFSDFLVETTGIIRKARKEAHNKYPILNNKEDEKK